MMDIYVPQCSQPFSEYLYEGMIDKSIDSPLYETIVDVWKSVNTIPGMKFVKYEWNPNEHTIDINKYIRQRGRPTSSTKKPPKTLKKNSQKYLVKDINDSRVGVLTVYIDVVAKPEQSKKRSKSQSDEPKLDPNKPIKKRFVKSMLIPIEDEHGRLYINGHYFNIIWQLLEKSTYTYKNQLVFKSNMRIAIHYNSYKLTDVIGNDYTVPIYTTTVRKELHPVMLMFAVWNNGLIGALAYLGLCGCVDIIEGDEVDLDSEEYLYFKISNNCYVRVIKQFFDKYIYIRSVVAGCIKITTNRCNYQSCMSDRFFLLQLGGNNYEKGVNYRQSFFRGIDVTVQKNSILPRCNKRDIYSLVRWLCENYQELRKKHNPDYANKRIRRIDQISSIFLQRMSEKAMRTLMSKPQSKTMKDYKTFLDFPTDMITRIITGKNSVIQFDNSINDMTFFSNFKYTTRGHQSSGNTNSNNMMTKKKSQLRNKKRMPKDELVSNASHIGRKDLTATSNNDPGATGILSPFNKLDGLYFDRTPDPDNFLLSFYKDMTIYMREHGRYYIAPSMDATIEQLHAARDLFSIFMDNSDVIAVMHGEDEIYDMGEESLDVGSI